MIPLAIPHLAGNEAKYLQECVETNFVSTVGPFVSRFEDMVATASGAQHAVATSSGTTGLHAALVALGVGHDDLVVIPSFTFIATANAVSHAGATPWLFDVTADSWTLNADQLNAELTATTERDSHNNLIHRPTGRRVAAIIAVYTFGAPADMDELRDVANRFDLPLIADAAAALGSRYKGRDIATLGADLTVFSFNGNKTITAGGGGVVAGDDNTLVARVRHLTTTARVGANYDHDVVGFNYRMTNLQAAVGCAQMEMLDTFVATKRRIRRAYDQAFESFATPFPEPTWSESACWFSGFITDTATATRVRTDLQKAGIDARPTWKPMHLQAPYAAAPRASVEVADSIWGTIVTLPCSTGISDDELDAVIRAVKVAMHQ